MLLEFSIDELFYKNKIYAAEVIVEADFVDNGIGRYEYGSETGIHVDIQLEMMIEDCRLKEYIEDLDDYRAVSYPYNDTNFTHLLEQLLDDDVRRMLIGGEWKSFF